MNTLGPIYDREHIPHVCFNCFNWLDDKDNDEICRHCQKAADQPEEEYYE